MAKKQQTETATVKSEEPTTAIPEQATATATAEAQKPKGKAPERKCPKCGTPNHPKKDICINEQCKYEFPKPVKGESAPTFEPAQKLAVAMYFLNQGLTPDKAIEQVNEYQESPLGQLIAENDGKQTVLAILKSLRTK